MPADGRWDLTRSLKGQVQSKPVKRLRFVRNLAQRARHFATPINSALLTNVILLGYTDARLKDTKYFHGVITEFECTDEFLYISTTG